MARSKAQIERLIRGAMGEIKSDLVITGGKLVNVYSGEVLDSMEIAVIDKRVCYVGPSAKHTVGKKTEVYDARGLYVSPGFIDGHTHIGHYCRPFEHLQSYVPHGTTALVASCDELSTVFGYRGLKVFLDEVERHPLRVYTLVSMVAPQDPLLCNVARFSNDEISAALADPRVLGMGEIVSWLRLLQCDPELLDRIEMAQGNGQLIHGHTAGARDQKLCAVAACGISSCHEPIRVEDALERLRLGYWTMLREGSLRQDLALTLKPLLELGIDLHRVILVTDSMTPDDVAKQGHMDHVLRQAVGLGMPSIQAIQAVTLNPASYSGLEQEVGGIAPGRWADFALLDDLEQCHVRGTWIGGKLVAKDGVSLVEQSPISLPDDMLHCLGLRATVSSEIFTISSARPTAKIRVMELINQTITAERIISVDTGNGAVEANLNEDLLKVAMFDRHCNVGKIAFGFLRGFGAKIGAIGLSTNLDENTLMVVGCDDRDMALCANALIECGGGIAVVNGRQIQEKVEFPLGGIFSLHPWREVGERLNQIQTCLRDSGAAFDKPVFALSFLPFVTLPSLRITSRGLINAKERKIVSLFVDEVA